MLEVPEGILVVRNQKPSADAPNPDSWWVIADNPALSGTDIKDPKQTFDQQSGNQPIVHLQLHEEGP